MTLPCSLDSRCASESMFASTSSLNLNMTRARHWRLPLALLGVKHAPRPLAGSEGGTADEMVDAAKHGYASWCLGDRDGGPLDPPALVFNGSWQSWQCNAC